MIETNRVWGRVSMSRRREQAKRPAHAVEDIAPCRFSAMADQAAWVTRCNRGWGWWFFRTGALFALVSYSPLSSMP